MRVDVTLHREMNVLKSNYRSGYTRRDGLLSSSGYAPSVFTGAINRRSTLVKAKRAIQWPRVSHRRREKKCGRMLIVGVVPLVPFVDIKCPRFRFLIFELTSGIMRDNRFDMSDVGITQWHTYILSS